MPATWLLVALVVVLLAVAFAAFLEGVVPKTVAVPVEFGVTLIGSAEMGDVLTYQVSAGPVVDHDVVTRELSCVVDGGEAVVSTFAGSATDLGLVTVPQGADVVLSLVDIDDAGNRSDAAVVSFVAADTIPPAAPGAFGVTLIGEAPAPEVAPEPAPAPEENPEA